MDLRLLYLLLPSGKHKLKLRMYYSQSVTSTRIYHNKNAAFLLFVKNTETKPLGYNSTPLQLSG